LHSLDWSLVTYSSRNDTQIHLLYIMLNGSYTNVYIIIINKVLIKVTLNKVIAGALYIVICG